MIYEIIFTYKIRSKAYISADSKIEALEEFATWVFPDPSVVKLSEKIENIREVHEVEKGGNE